MNVSGNIKKFLKLKLKNRKLKRKDFVQGSGIPSSTLGNITKSEHYSPTLRSIIIIADYFECSIDEVVGRNIYNSLNTENYIFQIVDSERIGINLKNFLTEKVKKLNLNSYKLSRELGFNEHIIHDFIKEDSLQQTLGSAVTIALADYFQVSVDEMIGRIKPTTSENDEASNE
ncbi:helix-turn-helix domain-containing protein [Candidatus Tisiphia endosymbiont of Oplodontha viridula]|uniref:helix-turn-helix domain-containing protein n=1 Tax=Candidatus Tisiphia endosymbiont of Oplodontha viridula TaxID=3077925 RepID=UPI0035C8ED4A